VMNHPQGEQSERASNFQKNEGIHIAKPLPLVTSCSALAAPYPFEPFGLLACS